MDIRKEEEKRIKEAEEAYLLLHGGQQADSDSVGGLEGGLHLTAAQKAQLAAKQGRLINRTRISLYTFINIYRIYIIIYNKSYVCNVSRNEL